MLLDSKMRRKVRSDALPGHFLRIYRGMEGFREIQPIWGRLTGQMAHPSYWHFYAWYESYMASLEPNPDAMLFGILYCGNEAIALLPLREKQMLCLGMKLNVLELPNHNHMKLRDIIFPEHNRTQNHIRALAAEVLRSDLLKWDCLAMSNLTADSGAAAFLKAAPFPRILEWMGTCSYIEIGSSYEDFLRNISKSLRKNLRVSNKRATAAGRLKNDLIRKPAELGPALQTFMELEGSGWKGAAGAGSAICTDPRLVEFYRNVVTRFGEMGACEIALLYLNERSIAGTLGFAIGDTLYSLKIAYDERYASMSPGNLQREKILQRYIAEGEVKYLNLVSGDSYAWHQRWKTLKMDTYAGFIFKRRLKPLTLFALKRTRRLLGRAVNAFKAATGAGPK
jgi:CelD/BcsL family acetyltransferase involved in cellulose biosynthesis